MPSEPKAPWFSIWIFSSTNYHQLCLITAKNTLKCQNLGAEGSHPLILDALYLLRGQNSGMLVLPGSCSLVLLTWEVEFHEVSSRTFCKTFLCCINLPSFVTYYRLAACDEKSICKGQRSNETFAFWRLHYFVINNGDNLQCQDSVCIMKMSTNDIASIGLHICNVIISNSVSHFCQILGPLGPYTMYKRAFIM